MQVKSDTFKESIALLYAYTFFLQIWNIIIWKMIGFRKAQSTSICRFQICVHWKGESVYLMENIFYYVHNNNLRTTAQGNDLVSI